MEPRSLLEPHLIGGDRPDWQGILSLGYAFVDVWLDDLALVRTRLGWNLFPADEGVERSYRYIASDGATENETAVALSLPVSYLRWMSDSGRTRESIVKNAFKTAAGRSKFLETLMALQKQPLRGGASVYDRILRDDIV